MGPLTTAAPSTSAAAGSGSPTTHQGGSATGSGTVWYNAPAQQATGTPFKIGVMCLCAQLQQPAELTTNTLDAWASWQNAHGGINGHPVQLIVKQDPGNPGRGSQRGKDLVSQHVVAIIDSDSEDDAAWFSYIKGQPVAIFPTGFNSLEMAASTDTFQTSVSQFYLFAEIMTAAQKVGGHKMAVLYCAENPACKQTVAPLQAAGKQYGIPVVFNAPVLASAPNYTAQCLAAKAAGADVMFIADGPAPTLAVASSCAQQGYTPHQVSDEAAYSQQMAGKPGWDGFLGSQDNIPFFVTSTPGSKAMHDALQKYQPACCLAAVQRPGAHPVEHRPADRPGRPGGRGRADQPADRHGAGQRHLHHAHHRPGRHDLPADLRAGSGESEALLVLGRHQGRPVVPAVRADHDLRPAQQGLTPAGSPATPGGGSEDPPPRVQGAERLAVKAMNISRGGLATLNVHSGSESNHSRFTVAA